MSQEMEWDKGDKLRAQLNEIPTQRGFARRGRLPRSCKVGSEREPWSPTTRRAFQATLRVESWTGFGLCHPNLGEFDFRFLHRLTSRRSPKVKLLFRSLVFRRLAVILIGSRATLSTKIIGLYSVRYLTLESLPEVPTYLVYQTSLTE